VKEVTVPGSNAGSASVWSEVTAPILSLSGKASGLLDLSMPQDVGFHGFMPKAARRKYSIVQFRPLSWPNLGASRLLRPAKPIDWP